MKIKFVLLVASVVLLSSCERENSSDVNQDRIYTIYSLVYDADQDVTYARAWFKFGNTLGTLLELTQPSYVSFNNENLGFQNAFAYYEKRMSGIVASGTFHWEDYDGNKFDNTIGITAIAFPEALTEIEGSSSFELSWEGEPIAEKSYVAVTINGDFEGDGTILWEKAVGSTSITIPKTELDKLPKNLPATFWIEYGHNPDLAQTTGAGGELYGKYRVSKEIMIK